MLSAILGTRNIKAKWKVLNTVLQTSRNSGAYHSDLSDEDHANAFQNLVQDLVANTPSSRNNAYLNYVEPVDTAEFNWMPVQLADIYSAIDRLKPQSSNYEGIASEAIKDCADSLAPLLAKFINSSLENGIYPKCLKVSRITPIFKGGNRVDPTNYRRVSIIPIFAKVFETVVHSQITRYMANHSLYASAQYGFTAGRSTVSACADLMDYIHKSVDEQYIVGVVLLDLSKAFDIINHRILLKKLVYYGFGSTVVKWFTSYLSCRVGHVNNNYLAALAIPGVGVPQGSVLGPLLFNLYVNDLENAVTESMLIQYADDTSIVVKSRKSSAQFVAKAQYAVKEVLDWFEANMLRVNFRKCCFITFGRNRQLVSEIAVGGHKIHTSDCVKLLGFQIDANLSYSSHINYVISRMKRVGVILVRFTHLFDRYMRQYLVKALILPVINLYSFIYASANSACLRRLDVAYNDLMRAILGVRRSVHFTVASLHSATNMYGQTV
jgi:hypothetical protein